MEAGIIRSQLPDLVTAISDIVQPVSDHCLAKGLIPESVYKRVLESGGTSEDKARTLVLAVKTSTETDSRCFEIFLTILSEKLPFLVNKLLPQIKVDQSETELEAPDHHDGPVRRSQTRRRQRARKVTSGTACQAIVPISGQSSSLVPNGVLDNQEFVIQQSSLITKLEDAIRKHEQSRSEQALVEKKLKSLSEESKRLKGNLRSLNSQVQANGENVTEQDSRLSACEKEMVKLKKKLTRLKSTVEEDIMCIVAKFIRRETGTK